jgi:Fic family protein
VERDYRTSHPWLTFELGRELTRIPELWALLGEAQSKCEHLAGVLIEPEVAATLQRLYLARGAAATTQIEGSPLTEDDALAVVEGRPPASNRDEDYERQIRNIVDACNWFVQELELGQRPTITPERIKLLNKLVLDGTRLDEGVVAGEISAGDVVVRIFNYRGAPRVDCEYLLGRLCDFLAGEAFVMPEHLATAQAILRAIVAHVYVALIHPFGDGNGRTARLMEVQILLASGVPAPAAHLLSNHYNDTRRSYYHELDRISKASGTISQFLLYALRGLVSQLAEQIGVVREYQREIMWREHVARRFHGLTGKPARRQRELILIISRLPVDGPLAASRLTEHSEVRALYAALDAKTLSRDVGDLKRLGLLRASGPGLIAANQDVLKSLQVRHYPVRPQAKIA